jgi:hypothetical protein
MTTKTIPISSGTGLSSAQQDALRALVALMIPGSALYQVPGADDEAIFADIASSLGRDTSSVVQAINYLDGMSDGFFLGAPAAARWELVERFRSAHPLLAMVLVAVTTRCYYRDDRVMRSIGMDPRPPFPQGFEVAQGDWSLLDPVRARGKIYRDAY